MKLSFYKILILISFLIGFPNYNLAQSISLSKNAKVSIITCETGNESYSLFGHTAIRINDLENNLDIVYNYGAFDFATPNFVAKFSKGNLQYFVVANSFSDFMNQYSYEQRSVYEQELNIPSVYKQKLFDNLNTIISTDERFYTYKFIDKNCTTMVIDIVNKTLGYSVIVKKIDDEKTYRSVLYPYFDNFFYEQLGTSIIFGSKVDQIATKIFLPLELQKNLKVIQFNNHALCSDSKPLLDFNKIPTSSRWNNIYTYLLFLILIVIINNMKIDLIYLSIMGVLGLFFAYMGFYSLHQELTNNYNILLFNPLLLFLVYFNIKKNKKWILNLCFMNLILLIIYTIILLSKAHLIIVLPLVITSCVVLVKLILKNIQKIPVVI